MKPQIIRAWALSGPDGPIKNTGYESVPVLWESEFWAKEELAFRGLTLGTLPEPLEVVPVTVLVGFEPSDLEEVLDPS